MPAILDWIGLGQDFHATLWMGLDWIHELVDWIGLGQQKWTHVLLWVERRVRRTTRDGDEAEKNSDSPYRRTTGEIRQKGDGESYVVDIFRTERPA